MRFRWILLWVLVSAACLGISASLPPAHSARAWLSMPAAIPLMLAGFWLISALSALWLALLLLPRYAAKPRQRGASDAAAGKPLARRFRP